MGVRLTVSALSVQLDKLLNRAFPSVSVEGELAQLQLPSSGHAYLTLKDGEASLQAVVWRSEWQAHEQLPQVGDRVLAHGRIGAYGGAGRYQLYANRVELAGKGQIDENLAKIRARLLADGLLDPRRKRPLPGFPEVIGVATSLAGAALQDFLRVSRERWPATRLLVSPCTVQGPEAAASVVRALELLYEHGQADLIVVTRGGGSRIDLMAFDDEQLARWIATAPVPVVSAVGHEIDKTLCDEVADVAVPTPTAAAVRTLPDRQPMMQRVDDAEMALARAMARLLSDQRRRLVELTGRLMYPGHSLEASRRRYEELLARLHRAMVWTLTRRHDRLEGLSTRLRALSPYGVLERGYAIVSTEQGVIRDSTEVSPGQIVRVQLARGTFEAIVSRRQEELG
jgi:exodeoxyribonuclease VII large subunit